MSALTPEQQRAWARIQQQLEPDMKPLHDMLLREADRPLEEETRRYAQRWGFLLRRNRSRDRGAANYGLWVLVDDKPENRRNARAAKVKFAAGEGYTLDEIRAQVVECACRDLASTQNLTLVQHDDGQWCLRTRGVAMHCDTVDEAIEYLLDGEHCSSCHLEFNDKVDHIGGWGDWKELSPILLACPACALEGEIAYLQDQLDKARSILDEIRR